MALHPVVTPATAPNYKMQRVQPLRKRIVPLERCSTLRNKIGLRRIDAFRFSVLLLRFSHSEVTNAAEGADDICLLASLLEQLQALIDALAAYCTTLQMEISVPKTKVMVVSAVPAPVMTFTCNDNPVEQVATFKYLGLHFHQSRSIAHLVTPIKLKAGGSWAAVQ